MLLTPVEVALRSAWREVEEQSNLVALYSDYVRSIARAKRKSGSKSGSNNVNDAREGVGEGEGEGEDHRVKAQRNGGHGRDPVIERVQALRQRYGGAFDLRKVRVKRKGSGRAMHSR